MNAIYFVPAAAIGTKGFRLFVDAGVGVDDELARTLVKDVLREKINAMLGQISRREPTPPPPPIPPPRVHTPPRLVLREIEVE